MSVDLRIYGIRKLCDEEIAELTGKTEEKICGSEYFRKLFPHAAENSRYEFYDYPKDYLKSIEEMLTPIVTADEDIVLYGYWIEELAYYWKNLSHDDPLIDEILGTVRGRIHYDQYYSVVPYELVSSYLNKKQPECHQDEITAISYV